MDVTVVTEGPTDARIIGTALSNRAGVRVVPASGRSAADSYARSILVSKNTPVVLVVDADSNDGSAQDETLAFHEASLRQVAPSGRWQVVVAKPTIESLLFENDHVVEHLFGRKLTPDERLSAKYSPKMVVIGALGGAHLADALGRLTAEDWEQIRNSQLLRSVIQFIDRVG